MIKEDLTVKKRNGSIEPLMLDKLHRMVEEACKNLSGVSTSLVEMHSGIQFYDGISTDDIQKVLIKSASDLISLEAPNYQFVAARLLLFSIRKQVYGGTLMLPHLEDHINRCVDLRVYDADIYKYYSKEEIDLANSYIDHDRDFIFTYAGLKQAADKYLCQDRSDGTIYETPQYMYIMIALTGFAMYPKNVRMSYIKRFYDAISKHKINLPTPVMASVRTEDKQYASCCLIEIDDDLDSICASDWAMRRYVAGKSGVGQDISRVRSIKSKIRGGKALSTGKIKYIQAYEKSLDSVNQNGLRKGSMTMYVNIWDKEIEKILELKTETGNDEDSARNIDYGIKMSRLFYERFINNQEISLFCPNDVPGLHDAFGLETFDQLYVQYEQDETIPKVVVKCQDLIIQFFNSRSDTGRYYIMNIDHCNTHSSFLDKINMSNLCVSGDTLIKIRYPDFKVDERGNVYDWQMIQEEIEIQNLKEHFNDIKVPLPVQVLSFDFDANESTWANISNFAETSPSSNVIKVIDNNTGKSIVVTPEHMIYTRNRGYVKAKDLLETDHLVFDSGEVLNENGITLEYLNDPIPVYDITVDDTQNFFANGILIHNCVEITLPTVPIVHIDDVGTTTKVKVKVPKNKVNEFNTYMKNNAGYIL